MRVLQNPAARKRFGYVAIAFIVIMFDMPAVFLCSTMLAEGGMGDAGVAGIVSSLFTGGGMIAGAIFAIVYATKRKVFAVFYLMQRDFYVHHLQCHFGSCVRCWHDSSRCWPYRSLYGSPESGGKASPAVRVVSRTE